MLALGGACATRPLLAQRASTVLEQCSASLRQALRFSALHRAAKLSEPPAGAGNQNRIFPVQMSLYITQSPMKLYSGRLNDAGLFFSKPKWPTQAKP